MARLRPLDVRRRKPSWFDDDDLPPAPLGSRRARHQAHLDFLRDYDELTAEQDDHSSPSYRRPSD